MYRYKLNGSTMRSPMNTQVKPIANPTAIRIAHGNSPNGTRSIDFSMSAQDVDVHRPTMLPLKLRFKSSGDGLTYDGELANKTGVRPLAIRFYERVGVLPQASRTSGQRRFGTDERKLQSTGGSAPAR
jgi:hypothetical protein